MTTMVLAPRRATHRSARGVQPKGAPASAIHLTGASAPSTDAPRCLPRLLGILGLACGLQLTTAIPAAVATLPSIPWRKPIAAAAAPVADPISTATVPAGLVPAAAAPSLPPPVKPALVSNPVLFSSILESAFPQSQRSTRAFDALRGPRTQAVPEPPVPMTDRADELLTFGSQQVPRWLVQAVLRAAKVTGVDPVYLMALADTESSLVPGAKASTSSAEGLFQFIESTWLETLHAHGAEHGFGAAAEAIRFVNDEATVPDESKRAWILNLRRDPYLSALMAGELIKDLQRELHAEGERELSEAELYIGHFLGPLAAVRFLQALDENPNAIAAKLFPRAAKANLGLFTEMRRRKRHNITVAEFYERIDSKIVRRLNRYDALARELMPTRRAASL